MEFRVWALITYLLLDHSAYTRNPASRLTLQAIKANILPSNGNMTYAYLRWKVNGTEAYQFSGDVCIHQAV